MTSLPPRPEELRALVAGATGLVGRECLRLLARDPAFGRVIVLTRRPLPDELVRGLDPDRLAVHVVDFADLDAHRDLFEVDAVFCALGTTIRKAGSRERFREVDHDYPLALARLGAAGGARHFLLVSAIGADPRSRVFYNRVKGEVEVAVSALPYRSLTLVRPSLLLGEREEFRLGEEVTKRLSFLLPGKYKAVEARAVAAALLQAANKEAPGRRVIESREIPALAEAYFASDLPLG